LIQTQRRSLARVNSTLSETLKLEAKGLLSQRDVNELIQRQDQILSEIKRHTTALRQLEKKSAVGQIKMDLNKSEEQQIHMMRQMASLLEQKKRLLEKQIKEATIRAPFDGYIGGINLERREGDFLQKGEAVAMVYSRAAWRIEALIPEQEVRKVQEAQAAEINLLGYPSTHFGLLQGRVIAINNIITQKENEKNGTPIIITIDRLPRGYQGVKPGMAAQVNIITRSGTIGQILWYKLKESLGQKS
jgi:multidrug resistance efflux pump